MQLMTSGKFEVERGRSGSILNNKPFGLNVDMVCPGTAGEAQRTEVTGDKRGWKAWGPGGSPSTGLDLRMRRGSHKT